VLSAFSKYFSTGRGIGVGIRNYGCVFPKPGSLGLMVGGIPFWGRDFWHSVFSACADVMFWE